LSVIVVVVLVALIVVVALVVGGEHGPARHVLAGGNLAGTPLVQLRR
jgi:hypothetical protein